MKKKIYLFGILVLFSLTFFSVSFSALCTTDNTFSLVGDKIVCGYCQYKDTAVLCDITSSCNLSIYNLNMSIIISNLAMINLGDGSFTYNISYLGLSSGNYIGLQNCYKNGYSGNSVFDIEILPASVTQPMTGGSVYVYQSDLDKLKAEINDTSKVEEKNMITDFKDVIKSIAKWIYPKNLFIGGIIVLVLLIIFIFGKEVKKALKNKKIKARET